MQNGEIDTLQTIRPITAAWKGGENTLASVESFSRPRTKAPIETYTDIGIVLFLIGYFLYAHSKILTGIKNAFKNMCSLKKQQSAERDLSYKNCRASTLFFLIVLFLFVFASKAEKAEEILLPTVAVFFMGATAIGLYALLKGLIFRTIDFVNDSGAFGLINKLGYNYAIVLLIAILCGEFVLSLFPEAPGYITALWYLICFAITACFYLEMGLIVFIKNRFSLFFYILYLCTLEILPIAFIVKII